MNLNVIIVAICLTTASVIVPSRAATAPSAVTPLVLAENGKATLPIVIATSASAQTKAVAGELAEYLKRISGATFEIETGDGRSGIVVGTLAQFPVGDLKKSLEIRNLYDGKEAYAIRTEKTRLLLLGATDLGASHAVFRFLETLGCRWFFPGTDWDIVPAKSTIRVVLDEVSRPVFLSRNIWWSFGFIFEPNKPKEQWRSWIDFEDWKRHNRMATSFEVNNIQGYGNIIEANAKAFAAHPEYYALVNGKRNGWQMCLSNPAVRKMAVDYALDYFSKNPGSDMVSLEPGDGAGFCECPECAKLGTISDRAFGLANEVARAVAKRYPGKMVGMLAYFQHSDPPSFVLEPNVCVQLATLYTQDKHAFDEQLDMWPKHTTNFGIYDYYSTYVWGQDRLRDAASTGPAASLNYLKTSIPRFAAHGARTFEAESSDAWGQYGIGYYVANKLLWNPRANVAALVDDFYEKAFGPAAPAMKRFYERISPDSKPLFGRDFMARAFRDVEEAGNLAEGHPDIEARLDDIKQYLHYNYLYWLLNEAGNDQAKRKAITLAILTHAYRTRFTYMMHAGAMMSTWTVDAAREFNEPTWSYYNNSPDKPWKVETSYTQDEIDREFREGLDYFQPETVDEKTFSNDLVPVRWEGNKPIATEPYIPGFATAQFFDGSPAPVRIALNSAQGEPLAFAITVGPSAHAVGATYKLYDSKGKQLSTGMLAADANGNKSYPLQLAVPEAGTYYLDVTAEYPWGFGSKAGRPAAIVLPRERNLNSYVWGGTPIFFYVPKGTREIQYYWSGYPHKVYNPQNEIAQEVKVSEDYVKIPVPEGMDGKVWGIAQRLGQLWLFNCPNVVAATPDALMIPRELAQKDGLSMRQ